MECLYPYLTCCVDPFSQIDPVLAGGLPWSPDMGAALTAWKAWSFRPYKTAHAHREGNAPSRRRRHKEENDSDAEAGAGAAEAREPSASPPKQSRGPGEEPQNHDLSEYHTRHPWGEEELALGPKTGHRQPAQDQPAAPAPAAAPAPGGAHDPPDAPEAASRDHATIDMEEHVPLYEMEGSVGLAPWASANNIGVRRPLWSGNQPPPAPRRYPKPKPAANTTAPLGYPRPVSWPPAAPGAQAPAGGPDAAARPHPHMARRPSNAARPASWPNASQPCPPPTTPPPPAQEQ